MRASIRRSPSPAAEHARRTLVLLTSWSLCLVQFLTILPSTPFVLLEPGSPSQKIALTLFLAGSPSLVTARLRVLLPFHLAGIALGIAGHPLTWPFGRDGSLVVMCLHLVLVLAWRSGARKQTVVAIASIAIALLAGEMMLSAFREPSDRGRAGLMDYGDVLQAYGPGGMLKPGLDARVVGGDREEVRFVTNQLGLRNREDIATPKPRGVRRVFLMGDSFMVGYRTDQDETLGALLQRDLRDTGQGTAAEVWIAGAGHPVAARQLIVDHLAAMEPDVFLIGLTIGNDISQTWLEHRRLPESVLAGPLFPDDAFRSAWQLLPVELDRSLTSYRAYRRVQRLVRRDVIRPWFVDVPGHVHLFDPGHSLGHFYARRAIPLVEDSYHDLFDEMDAIGAACAERHVPVVFLVVPQRFEVDQREWSATMFRFGLEPSAFDRRRPTERIMKHCSASGLSCADLLPALEGSCGGGSCYQPLGDMHWNAKGQALAARALVPTVRNLLDVGSVMPGPKGPGLHGAK